MNKTIVIIGSGVVGIPPRYGGAVEILIYELSKFMPPRFKTIVIDKKDSDSKSDRVNNSIYLRESVPKFRGKYFMRLTEFLFGAKALCRILALHRKSPVNVVHAHTVFTALPIAILKPILPDKIKFVYTCHNPAWTVDAGLLDIMNNLVRRAEGFIIRKFDLVTVPTDATKACLVYKAGVEESKVVTLHNFIDYTKFSRGRNDYFSNLKIDGPIVLFVGKLNPIKGIETLIRTIPLVTKKIKNVKFVVAGPVSFESSINDNRWKSLVTTMGVEDSVIFTGAIQDDMLQNVYSSSDIFFFPTKREVFGLVITEAMAAGLPIVSSDIPVVREVTSGASLLASQDSELEMANNIIRLLEDRKLYKKLSKLSLERAKQFDKSSVLKSYVNFYENI
jgi:glycosyltransferase involved in cell wall biosynthesis